MTVPKWKKKLTSKWLESLRPGRDNGEVTLDPGTRGHGALVLRVKGDEERGSKAFYFRYHEDSERRFELIGHFDQHGARAWREGDGEHAITHKGGRITLAAAREGFLELSKIQRATGDVRAHFAAIEEKRAAERRRKEDEARVGTFGDLLDVYVEALRDAGKPSAQQVDDALDRNVRRPFKHLLGRRAAEITPAHVQEILAKMLSRGVTREVNHLRSYLHAAFGHAGKHDYDPQHLAKNKKAFRLAINPVGLVPRQKGEDFNRIGTRVLEPAELRFYCERVEKIENPIVRAFLTVHLMAAGQRPTQLLRAPWGAYNLDGDSPAVELIDAKGRAKKREHLVPLIPEAVALLGELRKVTGSFEWPFTCMGHIPLHLETAVHAVQGISDALVEDARERGVEVEPFTARDVRRTVATKLAELGVSKEVRAYLLSHDRGGKIEETYNKYDYLPEKRRAVEAWWGFVSAARADASNVVTLKRKGAKHGA